MNEDIRAAETAIDVVKEFKQLSAEYGFTDVGFFDPRKMSFSAEFRQCCEDNLCGQYGANYSCPPYCGTVEEMRAKTLPFTHGALLKTECEVDDAMDETATKPIKKDHSMRSKMLIRELKKRGFDRPYLAMLAGCCSICDKCLMPSGKPCPFPDERTSCLSAYCLNVAELADTAGMSLSWDIGQVSFFSVFLW